MEPKSGAGGLTRWLRWPQDMLGRRRQRLVLHGFGLDDLAQHELQAMVPRLSRDLKLDLALSGRQGDVVLVESALRQTVS